MAADAHQMFQSWMESKSAIGAVDCVISSANPRINNEDYVRGNICGALFQSFEAAIKIMEGVQVHSPNIPSTQCGDCSECGLQSSVSSKCKLGRSNE